MSVTLKTGPPLQAWDEDTERRRTMTAAAAPSMSLFMSSLLEGVAAEC
jgi:hypothetical protein